MWINRTFKSQEILNFCSTCLEHLKPEMEEVELLKIFDKAKVTFFMTMVFIIEISKF